MNGERAQHTPSQVCLKFTSSCYQQDCMPSTRPKLMFWEAVPAEKGRGKRTDRHQGVRKKGEQIPSWLPQREHRLNASRCIEGESDG